MNILIFTASFHPFIGGLENHTLTLMYEFIRKGYQVKVIVVQYQESTSTSATFRLKDVDVFYRPGVLKTLQLYLWSHIVFMPNMSLKGMWLLPFYPFKKLIISHNDTYLNNKSSIKTKIKLMLIKLAYHNISVSKSVAGYINTKSTVIYNCYNNEIFKIYADEKRVFDLVFLGRLVSQKGCDLLLKALKNAGSCFTLNIIGDGSERPKLEQMVQNLGLQNQVKFLGILEGEELARTLNRHHVMVIPSLEEEGFGIVALEGMACGCKIIAADAGGLIEAVNGFGQLFKMGDQAGLEKLLNGKSKISDTNGEIVMSAELNNYLNAHSKEVIANAYLRLFE